MMLATKTMGRRKKRDLPATLIKRLRDFSWENDLKFMNFPGTAAHVRMVGLDTTIDIWPTTGHYYILETDYRRYGIIERQGEKGELPTNEKLDDFLATLFFVGDTL